MGKKTYLEKYIFKGLRNLNDGFDSESIKYFSQEDFKIVLDRVEEKGIGIHGIEPWKNKEFFDVKVCEEYSKDPTDPRWYRKAFQEFIEADKELMYAATYLIPDKIK